MNRWGKPAHYRRRRIWFIPTLWMMLAIAMAIVLARVNLTEISPPQAVGLQPKRTSTPSSLAG